MFQSLTGNAVNQMQNAGAERAKRSIATYHFPTSYETGNWLLFNIYVHEHSQFYGGEPANVGNINLTKDEEAALAEKGEYEGETQTIGDRMNKGFEFAFDKAREVRMNQIDTAIGLYLPENITFSYGVDWDGEEMGLVRSLAGAVGHIAGGVSNFVRSPGFDSFRDIMHKTAESGTGRDMAGLAVRLTAGLASLAGIPLDRLYERHQKSVLNKHTELHFNGVNLRSFDFNFKFYPRNVDEAKQIEMIANTFKFHMHPELSNPVTGLYMMYPSQFDITVMRGWGPGASTRNTKVARIGRVALTNCTVSHGEGEYVPIRGPAWSPNNPNDFYNSYTEMKLSFQELKVLTKEDIKAGF